MPDWTWLKGSKIPTPILYIDEANLLWELVFSNTNTEFMWFISMTKEQEKFHVLLCFSDSFMHNWLANFVGNDRFNTYSIGHLSKEVARRFWTDRIKGQNVEKGRLDFDEVYAVAGGILLRRMFLDFYFGGVHPNNSFFLQQAKNHLAKALNPTNLFIQDPLKFPPKWSRNNLITIMKELTKCSGGYVYYQEKIGQTELESMVEYNVLHLRPYFTLLCADLDLSPDRSESIVTPESQVD